MKLRLSLILFSVLTISCTTYKAKNFIVYHFNKNTSWLEGRINTDYDTCWKALVSILPYENITKLDYNEGVIIVKGENYTYEYNYKYHTAVRYSNYQRKYKIYIYVLPENENTTLVRLSKKLMLKRDIFFDWIPVKSNNVQCKVILYTLVREIYLLKAKKHLGVIAKNK